MDKRKLNGGTRPGAGAKKIDPELKKVPVSFAVQKKHVKDAKNEILRLIEEKFCTQTDNAQQ